MKELPPLESLFPANNPYALAWFWFKYWAFFFLLLPWMLLRQVGITCFHILESLGTWNLEVEIRPGLRLLFMNNLTSLAIASVFGERFTAIQYGDVLIDPGPLFGRKTLEPFLHSITQPIHAVVVTHAHEEHIGNAAMAAKLLGTVIYATELTLAALQKPEVLSLPRRWMIGQPVPTDITELQCLDAVLTTPALTLQVVASPGHCDGHTSLYDVEQGILFAGDSFMHTVFTSPNRDVSGDDWIETLKEYGEMKIKTMIGTHGYIYTTDETIPLHPFVVSRQDPNQMIRDKLHFMEWARRVVREGEKRQLPYGVIEACLFPWQHWWSWYTWFTDESGRLFSGGEFSRTYFVRSLSATPEQVPARFPWFNRLLSRLRPATQENQSKC